MPTTLQHPSLQRMAEALRETESDMRELNRELGLHSTKSESWHREQEEYYRDALSGRNDDFATHDSDATAQAVINIRDLMRERTQGRLNALSFASRVEQIITGLAHHRSVEFANGLEASGRLDEIDAELAARSDVRHGRRVDDQLTGSV